MEPLAEGRISTTTQIQQREGEEWRERESLAVWMQRQTQRPTALPMAEVDHGSALNLVLLGRRLAGKSSTGNTILGGREFDSGKKTVRCAERWGTVARRTITVADTPGWSQYGLANQEQVRAEIMRTASLHPPGPRAFLLIIPVDSFTEKNRRAAEEHVGLLGEHAWRRTLVLFTWGDKLKRRSIGQHIKKMGVALSGLLEKCGNRDLEVELPVNNRSYCPPNATDSEDVNGNVVEGSWRQEEERSCLQDIPRVGANTFGADASAIRQNLKNYFISEAGGVPWQWEHVRRT
ncbi:hypothetical protein SKAU_G00092830 [Synaphobranchus kaupii]|uniref:AIG1-type G domain-containing protein n=1 Tax=Synaphobranchus kaupii TaxID=118154 RepID=A0A9Q1J4H7_SYNKA|nr:hypothetical protein SKAU_G00092830 [Synaphobranchus kaupii]